MTDPLRILYVDDEPGLLEIGKLFLEREGAFSVDILTSARQALEQVKTERYDAIISDYQMPEMDGIAFLKQIKASGNTTPFIIFTGRGREEVVIEALNSGADFYLQKGGEPRSQFAELSHKIQMAVARKRTEKRAKDTERRLYDIINFLPDATFAIDNAGTVIAWNRAMEEMTGAKSSEIVGKDNYEYGLAFYNERRPMLIDLVLAPDSQFEKDKYLYTSHDSTLLTAETTLEKPDGHRIHLWGKASLLFDENGNLAGAIESIRDITERKEADEFIRLLAHISDDAPASITVHDIEGNYLYANEETLRLHGYTREEFLPKNLHEIDVPESEQLIAERMQKIRDEGAAEFDVQHFRKDGSILPLHVNAKPVDWGGRKVLLSIATDLSDRKRAEEALKESEDRFRAISEYSHNAICIIDEHAKILWVNDKMLALGGYSREQVYAVESFVGFIAPESIEFVVSNFSKVLAGEPYEHHYNFSIIRANGEKRLCEKYMMDVVDTHGKRNLIISMLDITERKRADEALRGSDARQRAMIANITDVIAIIDLQGIIRYKSENIEKIFGWKPEELVGLSFRETAHPEDVEQITNVFLKLIEDENASTTVEYRYKLKDGRFHTIHLTAKNLIHDPTINGVLVNYHDITDSKLAKDTLLKVNQKLNVLSQLTRQDLTTQIFVLNSYLEIAKKQATGQDGIIKNIESSERAVRSIKEITEFTKDYQNMGEKPPKWQNVKLSFLFGLSHISIGEIRHSLETENLEIFADPLLEKAFQGLLENSVAHGGHVSLIRVSHTISPEGATIVFEDDGVGIPDEKKNRIFLRGEGARASVRGLFFAREILDITGITIRETGEPGKGARFDMTVPKGAYRLTKT
jgi:PAS domain S-box-containing protein